ncbi:recombination protein RecR [bacterium]|nr:MAG: recombination protein RecR [bacterium]
MIAGPIKNLIREFKKLPGVGEKTATRLAMHVLSSPRVNAEGLASALLEVKDKIRPCKNCFSMTESEICEICSSGRRDRGIICVVEDQVSLVSIENAGNFFGLYHVLGGRLSPIDGVGPGEITVAQLVKRVESGTVREVILATNPSVDGEATALYVKRALGSLNVKVTRIARGIPMGGDLEYADALTLGRALDGRSAY